MAATHESGPRRRDAAASRQALLAAAAELFGTRGYRETTLREIGERAGVDAALIARYFGNKEGIYLAVLGEEASQAPKREMASIEAVATRLVTKVDRQGIGPLTQALFQGGGEAEIQEAAVAHLRRRFIAPLTEAMREHGVAQPDLRAETALAALLGVTYLRGAGLLPNLASADPDDLIACLVDAFGFTTPGKAAAG